MSERRLWTEINRIIFIVKYKRVTIIDLKSLHQVENRQEQKIKHPTHFHKLLSSITALVKSLIWKLCCFKKYLKKKKTDLTASLAQIVQQNGGERLKQSLSMCFNHFWIVTFMFFAVENPKKKRMIAVFKSSCWVSDLLSARLVFLSLNLGTFFALSAIFHRRQNVDPQIKSWTKDRSSRHNNSELVKGRSSRTCAQRNRRPIRHSRYLRIKFIQDVSEDPGARLSDTSPLRR